MAQETATRHKRGGMYFEDFELGRRYEHPLTRTVTQMDNMLFSNMTLNPQPLHIDRHFCEQETEWGQPLMNSLFTLGLMIGIQVSDMTVGTTIANLGMTEVKFPHPLFEGDTVHCTTEVIGKRAVELAARRRHRRIPPPRLQSEQQAGRRVPAPGVHAHAAEVMRSLLFVPADGGKKLDKAMASGADAVIVDLEDSISVAGKAAARKSAADFVKHAVEGGQAPSPAGAHQRPAHRPRRRRSRRHRGREARRDHAAEGGRRRRRHSRARQAVGARGDRRPAREPHQDRGDRDRDRGGDLSLPAPSGARARGSKA